MATTYEMAIKIAGKLDSTFSRSFMSAASTLQRHQREIIGTKARLKELEEAHKLGKISTDEYTASYAKFTAELEKAQAAQEKLAKAVNFQQNMEAKASDARGKLLRSTALMTAVLAGPVVAATKFESSMADVRKVMDFKSPEQFKAMAQDILEISQRVPIAASGIADIVAAAGQAGIAKEETASFTETAAKMAVAFDIAAGEAGSLMATWRTSFGMTQQEVIKLGDQINYLSNNINATAPDIASIVTKIGPLGKIAGLTAADVAALGGTLKAALGKEGDVSAISTGLMTLIKTLTAGASATKEQKELLKALGFQSQKIAKSMQVDPRGTIIQVFEAIRKAPKYTQTAIINKLFGEIGTRTIPMLIDGLGNLNKNWDLVNDATGYTGSMEKEFIERSKTTANAIQMLSNNINTLAIRLGSFLLPPLAETSQKLSAASKKVADWTDAHPKLTKALVLGTAGMLAFNVAVRAVEFTVFSTINRFAKLYVFLMKHNVATKIATVSTKAFQLAQKGLSGTLAFTGKALNAVPIVAHYAKVITITAATKAWTLAQKGLNVVLGLSGKLLSVGKLIAYNVATKAVALGTKLWAAAQWLLNAALSANPIGLIVMAIAGLVAGLVVLYKKSETVRAIVSTLWDTISAGSRIIAIVAEKINALISFLGSIVWPTSLGNLWSIITSGASSMFQTVTNALNWLIDKVNWFIDKLNKVKLPSWLPLVGGKGINIEMMERIEAPAAAPTPIPGHAEGGIFSAPHLAMVAEKGPEAILPLEKLLNIFKERKAVSTPAINITYSPASPVINIYEQGGISAERIRNEVLNAERQAQGEFEARLKAFLAQQRRLSYA